MMMAKSPWGDLNLIPCSVHLLSRLRCTVVTSKLEPRQCINFEVHPECLELHGVPTTRCLSSEEDHHW